MPIAFVISSPEEDIVNAVCTPGSVPGMNGSTFKFNTRDIPELSAAIRAAVADEPVNSERFNASVRLQERLGSWVGQEMAARAAVDKAAYKGRKKAAPKAETPEPEQPVIDEEENPVEAEVELPSGEDAVSLADVADVT